MQIVLHLVAPNDNVVAYGMSSILAGADKGCLGTAPGCMVGKTYLSQRLPDIEYFDCELPRIRRMLEDPQSFLAGLDNRTVVLDEIHRLPNPSELLKIATDHFPATKVLATGSSTLGASAKFRDTLAGRKAELRLTPMIFADLEDFQNTDLGHRFLFGGLPPFFLAGEIQERDFQEWLDSYWAKDIQEMFRIPWGKTW